MSLYTSICDKQPAVKLGYNIVAFIHWLAVWSNIHVHRSTACLSIQEAKIIMRGLTEAVVYMHDNGN